MHDRVLTRMLDALVDEGALVRKDGWYKPATPEEQAATATTTPAASRPRKPGKLPADWAPSDALREWARTAEGVEGATFDAYVSFFKDYAAANAKTYTDWDAAFRNCVRGDWGGIRKSHGFAKRAAGREQMMTAVDW